MIMIKGIKTTVKHTIVF